MSFGESFDGECFTIQGSFHFVDSGKSTFSEFSDRPELFMEASLSDFFGKFFNPLFNTFFVSEINL